jgi:hypothetical protein
MGGAVTRPWLALAMSVLVVPLMASCRLYERRWLAVHDTYCDRVLAELEADRGRPGFDGVGLRPAVLSAISPHPHGGPHACVLVGVEPTQWRRMTDWEPEYVDMGAPDSTFSTYTVESSVYPAGTTPAQALESMELGPARKQGVVEREVGGEYTHTLVTRRGSGVHLLWLRWYPSDDERTYIRCQAYLFGKYRDALPAFEAACAGAQTMGWE